MARSLMNFDNAWGAMSNSTRQGLGFRDLLRRPYTHVKSNPKALHPKALTLHP